MTTDNLNPTDVAKKYFDDNLEPTSHVQSELFEKIEQLKKEFTDKKIREL